MKAENKKQLVRGVVAAGSRSTSCVTADPEQAEKHGCCVAKTFWYRHDELNKVESALEALRKAYSQMSGCSGMSYYYEYKDYEK